MAVRAGCCKPRASLHPGRMQAGWLSRANPGVEFFLNDILVALIFAQTFQVFRGTCLARIDAERTSVLTYTCPLGPGSLSPPYRFFRKGQERAGSSEAEHL